MDQDPKKMSQEEQKLSNTNKSQESKLGKRDSNGDTVKDNKPAEESGEENERESQKSDDEESDSEEDRTKRQIPITRGIGSTRQQRNRTKLTAAAREIQAQQAQ